MATIQILSPDGQDQLGIDEFNRLYWKGEQIVTSSMIHFPTWIYLVLAVGAVGTFGLFMIALFRECGFLKSNVPIVNVTVNLAEEMPPTKRRTSTKGTSED